MPFRALFAVLVVALSPAPASAEQAASERLGVQHGKIDAGAHHSCAVLAGGRVRCWGQGVYGQLGYANTNDIGDDETPASAGSVHLGAGRTATAITAGFTHTCALLDDRQVRCWGEGAAGKLGYGNTKNIGDNETPGSVGPINLGIGRTVTAITAGSESHTCALLDNGQVRCWGLALSGQLGYANTKSIGDDETPGSVAPIDLGAGRTATAITAGKFHTCALLDNGQVRCWGFAFEGQLGRASKRSIGDDETPGSVAPIDLGAGRTATAITAGEFHTCALLDDRRVRCWGGGSIAPPGYDFTSLAYETGSLGYGNAEKIGDNETPASAGPVKLGVGRRAKAITAGSYHTCALLYNVDNGRVRCWGYGVLGRLGYPKADIIIGDNELPSSVGPVDLGVGRTARAITAGAMHTCAVLDNGRVRCWGSGEQLGYANTNTIGDDETPGSVGPVDLGGLVAPDGVVLPSSPKSLRVSKAGTFTYRFISIPKRSGKIGLRSIRKVMIGSKKKTMRLAAKSFKARASARVAVSFKLGFLKRKALKEAKSLSFKVTATSRGKTYTTRLRLRRPAP